MRKIEQDMLNAIANQQNWKCANTSVCQSDVIGDTETEVYLHGNLIAKRYSTGFNTAWNNPFIPVVETFRRWPTTTTRSRLRALGINASIKNGEACIDDVPV